MRPAAGAAPGVGWACHCCRGGLAPRNMSALKLLITGCRGRMGQAVAACAAEDPDVIAERQIDVSDDLLTSLKACDAVVDFSFHGFTAELAEACVAQGKLLVIGTTDHDAATEARIRDAAQ